MKNHNIFLLFFLSFFLSHCARESNEVARIDDFSISQTQFVESYKDFLFRTGLKDNMKVRSSYLNSLVDEQSILIYAERSGYRKRKDVVAKLSRLSDQVCINYFFKNYIYPDLNVSEDEIREAYRRSLVETHARHLYAADLNEANILKHRLETGESFEELARRVFKDSYLASHGGDLGWFSYGDMEPSFEDAAYDLNIGEISAPVRTKYGYSIIQVLNRRYNPFVREDDFQRKKSWLMLELKRRKLNSFVQEKTDAILDELELRINRNVLPAIFGLTTLLMDNPDKMSVEEFRRETGNEWIIKSKGEVWTQEIVLSRLKEVQRRQWERVKDVADLEDILKGLAIREEIEKRIERLGIRTIPEVRKEIENVCNHKVVAMLLDSVMDQSAIPDSLLLEKYNLAPEKYITPEMAEIAEIGVGSMAVASRIKKRLESGEDFASLARKYSLIERSRVNGGYLGWGQLSQFGKLKGKIKAARPGEIIGPYKIANMFILILVKDKKESRQLTFDEAKLELRNSVWRNYQRKAYEKFMQRVKKGLQIEINHDLVQDLTLESTGKI